MNKLVNSVASLLVAGAMAGSADAAVTVFGGGLARDCYLGVESGDPARQVLPICDLALQQERLTSRDRAATYVNRGIVHMREGRFEMALRDYSTSARIQPDLADAQVNRGAALYGLQRYDEAMDALNVGITAEDANVRAIGYYNRALTHEKLGDIQSAYEDFHKALEIEPEFELAAQQLERFQVIPASD